MVNALFSGPKLVEFASFVRSSLVIRHEVDRGRWIGRTMRRRWLRSYEQREGCDLRVNYDIFPFHQMLTCVIEVKEECG